MATPARDAAGRLDGVFPGDGRMAALMRTIDWGETPLGPTADWSQALCNTLALILRAEFPFILWWGPRHVQFYNDAYRPIPGDKHPRSMGQAGSECFEEIWHIIGPMIEAPYRGGPASRSDDLMLLVNRKGFLEETHFKISYSPVPDPTARPAGIGGVLGTISEITQQTIAERQLRSLRELGAQAAEAKTSGQACRAAAATLADNPWDVPFALFYLFDPASAGAQLAASCGFETDGPANPAEIVLEGDPDWPLGAVVQGRTVVVPNLEQRFGRLPSGRWDEAPKAAIALPLASHEQARPYGALILGLSPHRELDDGYRTFVELAAGQVATAIRNASAYQEERERAEALAEIDRAKTTFFSNVSHEFRTPLTLLAGPIQDALADPDAPLPASQRERLEVARRNALRLHKLVNTLLDFSRIEAGRIAAAYAPTDLPTMTAELAGVFRSAVERAGLRLVVDCPPLPEPVYVDPEMWEKIVLNLLSNAFKFTFEGEIEVALRRTGGQVELQVRDTGVGIPAEELGHIFERFHRGRNLRARTHEGSGIGLSLVQELAKLHAGSLSVQSEVGSGSTFRVCIPLGTAHLPPDRLGATHTLASTALGAAPFVEEALRWLPGAAEVGRNGREVGDELPSSRPMSGGFRGAATRILVADDNADMREYLTRLLAPHCTVETVADGMAALEAVRRDPPDLLLTDVMMPGLDGLELLGAIRADQATRELPIVLLSARAGEESRLEGLAAGADDYLVKPFSARELVATLGARLELSRVREEAQRRREQAEQEVRRSERLLAEAQRLAHIGSWEWNVQTGEVAWSPELYTIYGVDQENFVPTISSFADYIHPEDQSLVSGTIERILAGEGSVELEFRIIAADGATRTLSVIGQIAERDEAGNPRLMVGANQDVTERKRAEAALRESEARYRTIVETAQEGIWLIDAEDRTTFVNQKMADLLGYTVEEMLGQSPRRFMAPEFQLEADERLSEHRQGVDHFVDYRFIRRDGSDLWCILSSRALLDETGQYRGSLAMLTDITGRKRAEAALQESAAAEREARELADAAVKLRDDFLSVAAHELKTPVASLQGYAQLTLRVLGRTGSVDPVRLARSMERIEQQSKRLGKLTDQLLNLSRLQSGKLALSKEQTDLTSLVRNVVADFRLAHPDRAIELRGAVAEPVLLDPLRVEQVLVNLLDNAIKFSPSDSRVDIEVGDPEPGWLEVGVRDRGMGISEDDRERVFARFFQAQPGLGYGGMGIGLFVSQEIAELHGGSIWLEQPADGGSRFVVRLPR